MSAEIQIVNKNEFFGKCSHNYYTHSGYRSCLFGLLPVENKLQPFYVLSIYIDLLSLKVRQDPSQYFFTAPN